MDNTFEYEVVDQISDKLVLEELSVQGGQLDVLGGQLDTFTS